MNDVNKLKRNKIIKKTVSKKKPKNITIVFPKKIDEDIKESLLCPISLQCMIVPCITKCDHIFDFGNINQWITKCKNCPICREIISDTTNLDNDHVILKTLQKIKIKYKRKTYTYTEFIEQEYNFIDEFIVK
jgi:hypothetical protein